MIHVPVTLESWSRVFSQPLFRKGFFFVKVSDLPRNSDYPGTAMGHAIKGRKEKGGDTRGLDSRAAADDD